MTVHYSVESLNPLFLSEDFISDKNNYKQTNKQSLSSLITFLNSIENNKQYLESLKNKSASEWREFATQCMVEIVDNKK